MKNLLTFLSIACILVLYSCKDKTPDPAPVTLDQLKITVQPTFGSSDLQLDQTVITNEGYALQFTDIRFYLTTLKNTSGKQLTQAALFDYRESGINLLTADGKPADFSSINGFFGVDSTLNHDDPTAFATTNPLNILTANDMHWDWNPGYIFLKIEAKVDTISDGVDNFNHYVVFHVGADAWLQQFSLTGLTWSQTSQNLYTLPLKLDMQKFLQNGAQTIDVKTEHSSHSLAGEEALSIKVIQNLRDALSPM
jgi:archaellin